jgi:iron complex transport system substrate-binding protein
MRRWVPFLLLLSVVFTLFGCGQKAPQQRPVREKFYARIVSLSPSTTELVGSTADITRLVGRTQACNWPTSLGGTPVVASVKPDYERITEIDPDLVVYDGDLFNEQDIERLKAAAPNADFWAMTAKTYDEYIQQVFELGSLLGTEMRMNDYINKVRAERAGVEAAPYDQTMRVAIVMPGGGVGGDMIAGTNSFLANIVRIAGGEPVGPDADNFVPVNPEALVGWNPDVILVPASNQDTSGAVALIRNPQYSTIGAVRERRVRAINSDIMLRRGSRLENLIAGVHASINPGEIRIAPRGPAPVVPTQEGLTDTSG